MAAARPPDADLEVSAAARARKLGKLKPSKTVYVSWGKGGKQRLQFSKSGHPRIEEAYATHFVKQVEAGRDNASDSSGRDPVFLRAEIGLVT